MRPSTSGTMPGVKPPTTTLETISDNRRGADGGEQHGGRLDQERGAQRRAKSRAVAEMAGEERADDGAEAVQHPVMRSRRNALAEAARDEVDEEDHVRHQRHRVEAILRRSKRADGGRGLMATSP